jgi:2-keto-3-deoxy-L-rhamnonate aldolase RhmA
MILLPVKHESRKGEHMASGPSVKEKIRNGDTVVALRLNIEEPRSTVEKAVGKGNYDLLYVDGQHLGFSDQQLVSFCSMAEDMGLPVQFRIPHTRNTYLIGRYLDMGLSGILVPEVIDPATVDKAIAFSYYPQQGSRSWGGAARYGAGNWDGGLPDRLQYAAWWNTHVILGVQLESVQAISGARELARPGVDYLAFGPNDLTFSLEGHPEYPLRTVNDCMRNVAAQLEGTGIRLGMAVTTEPDEREPYLEMGITIFQEAPRR